MENQQEKEFTAEELAAQKEQMLQFYTESLPYLEAQLKYEQTLAAIDEARFKRTNIQMQYAMMAQAQQEIETDETDDDNEPSVPEQGKRKLRKG
jgi:threonyl-tRNA synthetase